MSYFLFWIINQYKTVRVCSFILGQACTVFFLFIVMDFDFLEGFLVVLWHVEFAFVNHIVPLKS
jgi:hypothetical protein